MKSEERYEKASKVIEYINENVPGHKDKFNVFMTALALFFVNSDPVYDQMIDGLETELYRIIKAARASLEKKDG
jgi:hypothetical protein